MDRVPNAVRRRERRRRRRRWLVLSLATLGLGFGGASLALYGRSMTTLVIGGAEFLLALLAVVLFHGR